MAHLALRSPDEELIPLLRSATSEDLGILVEFILKASTAELGSVPDFRRNNPRAFENIYDGDHSIYADDIAAEIQKFGGNTLANIARGGKGVPYSEVVRDIAEKLSVSYGKNTDTATIETHIQIKIMEKAYEKMNNDERAEFLKSLGALPDSGVIPSALPVMALQTAIRLSGFAAYKLAAIVANAIARFILGRGLSFVVTGQLMRTISAFAGPIGWAVTILWTIVDIAGPAYRVTIPCVLHTAYLRQKALMISCPSCDETNSKESKFCNSCGNKLE